MRVFRCLTALILAVSSAVACSSASGSVSAAAAARALCGKQYASVGGSYIVQNNEYFSHASECVTVRSGPAFTVTKSAIANRTDGGPGGYPSIYQGCHWGVCSSGGLAAAPVRVSALTPGKVTTTWRTVQPASDGAYNVAYDIWFNKTPRTSGQPDCTELMVWLNHQGGIRPFGKQITGDVTVGGRGYDIWEGPQKWGDTITYLMTAATTSVTGLDIGTLAQDAVHRGYLSRSCYLIDVEAGFELWHGGAGLATGAFSVTRLQRLAHDDADLAAACVVVEALHVGEAHPGMEREGYLVLRAGDGFQPGRAALERFLGEPVVQQAAQAPGARVIPHSDQVDIGVPSRADEAEQVPGDFPVLVTAGDERGVAELQQEHRMVQVPQLLAPVTPETLVVPQDLGQVPAAGIGGLDRYAGHGI
jgi:hypothetical protein